MDPILGTIILFAGNFAPRGWALCDGQIMSIAQYTAVFSILGTTYGGNGQTTFALPDLRGRVPMHVGQGPGLTNRVLGQVLGAEAVALTSSNIPGHSHQLMVSADPANDDAPTGLTLAGGQFYNSATNLTALSSSSITPVAGNQLPISTITPALGLNYIIALEGIFPSRN
jgi:microcystin-dependent protein